MTGNVSRTGDGEVGKTLIIGTGEIGAALAQYHESRELNYAVLTRTLRASVLNDSSALRTQVLELGVKPPPEGLLKDVDTILYAAGTPRPSAPLSATAAVIGDELVPLQAMLEIIGDSDWHGSLIFASSGGTIYGVSKQGAPWTETDLCLPVSAYGIAKNAAENLLLAAVQRANFKLAIARISNVIGTRLNYEVGIGFVQAAVHRIIRGLPIEIYGDGSSTRDFIDVTDVATILPNIAQHSNPTGLVVNVSTGIATSLLDVIAIIESETNTEARLKFSPVRSSDVNDNVLCNHKLNSLLSPSYTPLVLSIRRVIADFRSLQSALFSEMAVKEDGIQ